MLSSSRYVIRFPEELRRIDPEFTDRWMLPFYHHRSDFALPPEADLSPLARMPLTPPGILKQNYPGFFQAVAAISSPEQVPPLAADEEAELFTRIPYDTDARGRIFDAYIPAALSAAHDYAPGDNSFFHLAVTALETLLSAIGSYVPSQHGGFLGYALWHIRIALIRSLWDRHPENLHRGTGLLVPEYRLQNPEEIFGEPAEEERIAGVLSMTPLAALYRELKQEPQVFAAVMDRLSPREAVVIELVLRENCLLTLYDAADRFGVSPERILQILRRFLRWTHHPRIRKQDRYHGFFAADH